VKNLKIQLLIAIVFLVSVMSATTLRADLEWITGETPKNTPEASASGGVPDAPAAEGKSPAAGGPDIILCHLITCTKMAYHYPLDSQNFFYLNKHNQVGYFAYFLLKPSSRIHNVAVECYSPNDVRIARYEKEYKVGFTDNLLNIHNDTYQFFLVEMTLGLDRIHPEFGQGILPRDVGRYTVHLTVDGQLAGITFFWVKSEEPKNPSASATPASVERPKSMPIFTPSVNGPLRRTLSPPSTAFTPIPQAAP
jgi:hypothetical protein